MSVTVYLANKAFVLPATEGDISRRNAYFKNPSDSKNQLKPEEDKILLALGINKEMTVFFGERGVHLFGVIGNKVVNKAKTNL